MPLNKDILGTDLYNAEKQFNDKNPDQLGDIETARLNFWKVMADEIIKHIKTHGEGKYQGGLTAGTTPVTGAAGATVIKIQ